MDKKLEEKVNLIKRNRILLIQSLGKNKFDSIVDEMK